MKWGFVGGGFAAPLFFHLSTTTMQKKMIELVPVGKGNFKHKVWIKDERIKEADFRNMISGGWHQYGNSQARRGVPLKYVFKVFIYKLQHHGQ